MSIRRAARYACTVSAQCICIVHDCGHAGPYNYICSISRTESFVTGSHTYRQHSANSEQVSTITCMYGPHVRTVLVGTHANRCQTMELAHHPQHSPIKAPIKKKPPPSPKPPPKPKKQMSILQFVKQMCDDEETGTKEKRRPKKAKKSK